MAKTGFKHHDRVGKGGGQEKESYKNIAMRGLMSRLKTSIIVFGQGFALTPLGEFTMLSRTLSRLGRGYRLPIPSPFSTPLDTLRVLLVSAEVAPSALQSRSQYLGS